MPQRRIPVACLTGGLTACALAPAAAGQATGGDGGAVYVAQPTVKKVGCVRGCASRSRAQGGSTVRITGSSLSAVVRVVFRGGAGRADDTGARVRPGSDRRIQVRVPYGAVSGRLTLVTADGTHSAPSPALTVLPAPPPEPNAELTPVPGPNDPLAPRAETGTSRTKAFVGARRAVTFSFRLSGAVTNAVTVDVVSASDGETVRSWTPDVTPGEVESLSWDGRVGRAAAPPGRYSFRLTASGAGGATLRSAQSEDQERDAFDLYDNIFPVRGRHDFGGAGARFGTGRAGHSHQGHDLFARCGTPMVAARGGTVQFKQYHGAAGHYLVIDGAGTGTDYVYMHLDGPSPFSPGDRVYTGQRIGAVGDSGNARGCHLHFELWRSPGWYDGGRPFDPLPSLRSWDAWS